VKGTAEIVAASHIVRMTNAYLDPAGEAGLTPAYIQRRGRLDGVMLRLDVWESLRDQATLSIDLAERDELSDRWATAEPEDGTLGELAAPLRPSALLADLPVRFLPVVRGDILTASRTPDCRNIAGFLAHWTRGYLRGTAITDPSRPGAVLYRDVAPAYYDDQIAFRIVWAATGPTREDLVLVAVRPLQGTLSRAWMYAPPMDASTDERPVR